MLVILLSVEKIDNCENFVMPVMKRKRIYGSSSLSGEKKYYLADLGFYYAERTDNRVNYGPTLENILYVYACSQDCSVSVGRIGKLECDFILRNNEKEPFRGQAFIQLPVSPEGLFLFPKVFHFVIISFVLSLTEQYSVIIKPVAGCF